MVTCARKERELMTFEEWKQENCPGWYLNSRQQDEELFEQYLNYQRKDNEIMKKGILKPCVLSGKIATQGKSQNTYH